MTHPRSYHCPPRHIVLGVDFDTASARAAALAGVLATTFAARLEAVHGEPFTPPPYFTPDQIARLAAERQTNAAVTSARLREFVAAETGAAFAAVVADGEPVEGVLERAAEADLIVLGTHGRRGPQRWWLGSVADRIVRASAVPVLVTHADHPATAAAFARVAVVGDGAAGDAARSCAAALATAFGGQVVDGGSLAACRREALDAASLVVVALDGSVGGSTAGQAVGTALTGCTQPVLFVPGSKDFGRTS
ncbi:MAG: universal stress protein [Vicinamibacterales bacterium]